MPDTRKCKGLAVVLAQIKISVVRVLITFKSAVAGFAFLNPHAGFACWSELGKRPVQTEPYKRLEARLLQTLRPSLSAKSGHNLCVLEMTAESPQQLPSSPSGMYFSSTSVSRIWWGRFSETVGCMMHHDTYVYIHIYVSYVYIHTYMLGLGIRLGDSAPVASLCITMHLNAVSDLKSWTKQASYCKVGLVVENPVVISSTSAREHGTMKPNFAHH